MLNGNAWSYNNLEIAFLQKLYQRPPETTSRKYGYADDLTILLQRPPWKEMKLGLN